MRDAIKTLKAEVRDVLENNILNFWLNNMVDNDNGGFYGQMTGEGILKPMADKGSILNARILWSFSAAYRVLSQVPNVSENAEQYLAAATRAKDYIIEHFFDKEYGGVYWSLDYMGNPKDTRKQFYAISFMVYGLSEYFRATGDREALEYALSLFECIEDYSFDKEHNGYIEACTREWGEIADMRLSDLDANFPKSQNTHLHVMESYTSLYRAIKECCAIDNDTNEFGLNSFVGQVNQVHMAVDLDIVLRLESSLRNLISIFIDKIINPETYHLDLFFDMEWTRKAGNLESYGHDIECSWLMHEAALALGDETLLKKVESIVYQVAKASEKGLNTDGAMVHEANLDTGYVDTDRHWWVQAENVVGQLNIYQYFGDETALRNALDGWKYIKDHLIDLEDGEWFWSCDQEHNINRRDDKAGFWKCPYHNSRMCLEIIERQL